MADNKNRILLISPAPTHPANSGHRVRIKTLCEVLSKKGAEIFFLYIGMEGPPGIDFQKQWQEKFFYFPSKKGYKSQPNLTFLGKFARKTGILPERCKYNQGIDEWFDDDLIPYLKQLNIKHQFSHVWVEYVFLSKTLLAFGKETIKILDTHDVFTNRYKLHLKAPHPMMWFSTSRREEKKGLLRADTIVAIQSKEERFFQSLCKGKTNVVNIGHYSTFKGCKDKAFEGKILFIGSENKVNREAYYFLVNEIHPELRKKNLLVQIIIAGAICNNLENRMESFIWGR